MTQKIHKTVRVQSYFGGDIKHYKLFIVFIVISVLRLEYMNLR